MDIKRIYYIHAKNLDDINEKLKRYIEEDEEKWIILEPLRYLGEEFVVTLGIIEMAEKEGEINEQ